VSKRCYYDVLGLSRTSTETEIKAAYRRLAIRYHPDKNPGDPGAEERFKEAAEANEVLSDPQKRDRYDRFGHAGVNGEPHFTNVHDIFSAFGEIFGGDLFGSFFGGARPSRAGPRRGPSLEVALELEFEEMARGVTRMVHLRRHETCPSCHGSGSADGRAPVACERCGGRGVETIVQGFFSMRRPCGACGGEGTRVVDPCSGCSGSGLVQERHEIAVTVPAGIEDGMTLRVHGEGEAGPRGGGRGDLHCVVRVREHPLFVRSPRDPADLFVEVPVPLSTALLGGAVRVPTLDGAEEVKVPGGTEPGSTISVRGHGLPVLQGRRRGDLFVRVVYDVPKRPGRRFKRALEGLREAEEKEIGPARRAYEDRLGQHATRLERLVRDREQDDR
jgi:molecular chaperone DnaJ